MGHKAVLLRRLVSYYLPSRQLSIDPAVFTLMGDEDLGVKTRYAEAVEKLNSLQSNASVLAKVAAAGDAKRRQPENMKEMQSMLKRLEITNQDLAKLSYIHVSGTKGKGSVCAFTESLLRHRGLKTGFYSSPHLVEVRERIRINGRPLSKEKFIKHFWDVFNKLEATKTEQDSRMPPYFRFLTLVGLRVFLDEAVDVAVMEVGVGGRFDCTNVIPAPVVCGITPLGFDHVNVLGHTIDEIAWNKAGIMKKGCPIAVTSPGQPGAAQSVLQSEADAVECRLTKAPPLDSYPVPMSSSSPPILGIHGPPQLFNASMALQLSETWLRHKLNKPPVDGPFPLDHIHLEGLKRTEWPGRCSIIQRSEKLRIHLDGAHTRESLRGCIDWFSEVSKDAKVAVFNITGGRDSKPLLKMLQVINFELVIFCPNLIHSTSANQPDLDKVAASRLAQLKVCESLHAEWRNQCGNNPPSVVLHSVEDVLQLVDKWENRPELNIPPSLATADHVDVLITGSLHLVGNFYALLNPDLNS